MCWRIVHKLFHKLWWNCCDESFVKVLFHKLWWNCCDESFVKVLFINCDEIVVMKLWKYVVKIWWSICHSIVVIKVVIKNCLMICWNNLSPICCESFVTKMWQDVLNVCVKMCWNVDDEIILLNCFCDWIRFLLCYLSIIS